MQYMKQLDRYMKEIENIHEEDIVRENYALPTTIGEKIAI